MPELEITDSDGLLDALQRLRDDFKEHGNVSLNWKTKSTRTDQQRKSLEVWCRQLAEVMNAHDIGMKALLAVKDVDVPMTQELVKNAVFRPVYTAISGEESTTCADTTHFSRVHQILCKNLAEKLHIEVPAWPSRFGD